MCITFINSLQPDVQITICTSAAIVIVIVLSRFTTKQFIISKWSHQFFKPHHHRHLYQCLNILSRFI